MLEAEIVRAAETEAAIVGGAGVLVAAVAVGAGVADGLVVAVVGVLGAAEAAEVGTRTLFAADRTDSDGSTNKDRRILRSFFFCTESHGINFRARFSADVGMANQRDRIAGMHR